ncbi:MAG: Uma2 family endonuclease [Rubrobacter sp.]|nr:Uma2 family endonuclease [Rubrobacter sp.]MDQ3317998.1 Uma2 family endonuclease [Actinomycetota bacterium]
METQAEAQVTRRRFTVHEYHRMGEVGILHEDDRVELIEGELIQMTSIGTRHFTCVNALTRLFVRGVGDEAIVSVQNPVRLNESNEPQPDLTVIRNTGSLLLADIEVESSARKQQLKQLF